MCVCVCVCVCVCTHTDEGKVREREAWHGKGVREDSSKLSGSPTPYEKENGAHCTSTVYAVHRNVH